MKRRRLIFLHFSQIRRLVKKFAIVLLFIVAFVFMMLNKTENVLIETTSSAANEVLSPAIDVLVMPATLLIKGYDYFRSLRKIDMENKELRKEIRHLIIENTKTRALEIENNLLSQMLNYVAPPEASFVTARVVAEEGNAFSHAITVYIGDNQKILKGQVAIGTNGVIGRVESVGRNYAKIFLINDISSKIPVMIEKSRTRAILSGENTPLPKLIFVPLDAELEVGDTIVTSGVGGIFPAGLLVGRIVSIDSDGIKVKPFNDLSRLEYVQIVDYRLPLPGYD